MPVFNYKAIDPQGKRVFGRLDAANDVDLEMRLSKMALTLVSGEPSRSGWQGFGNRVPRGDLINFCFHLEQLARSGVPLLDALADLRDTLEHPRFRETVASLIEGIEGGLPFSAALAEHPQTFDGVFVSLVRAGEQTGRLPDVLQRLNRSLKWEDEIISQTRKLVMYPSFVALVIGAVVLFLMLWLVPQMTSFFRNMGQELPTQTRLLIGVSTFLSNWWWLVLTAPVAAIVAILGTARINARVRHRVDQFKLAIPVVGGILRKLILARFASTFAMLYASGITVLDAISATEDVVGNSVMKRALQQAGQRIGEGSGISKSFEASGLFPPLVTRMLRVGESTGRLDTALENVGYFYERDVRESVGRLQAMIEPMLTLVLGGVLGWVMIAVLGPVYDIITRMQG